MEGGGSGRGRGGRGIPLPSFNLSFHHIEPHKVDISNHRVRPQVYLPPIPINPVANPPAPIRINPVASPVNILSNLPNNFYTKIDSKVWANRKNALEELQTLLQNPKLESGDYGALVNTLKETLKADTNISNVELAGKCIASLAKGVGKEFSPHALDCVAVILEKFTEKKLNVVRALEDAIDAIYPSTTLDAMKVHLLKALDNTENSIKAKTASFLARAIARTQPAALNKKLIKALSTALQNTLSESDSTVVNSSAEAIVTILKVLGEKVVNSSSTKVTLPTERELTPKEIDEKAVELLPEEIRTELVNSNWENRFINAETFLSSIDGIESKVGNAQTLVRTLCKKPGLKEPNPKVLKVKLDALAAITEKLGMTTTTAETFLNEIVALLADTENSAGANQVLTSLAKAIQLEYVVSKVISIAFEQKSPKVQAEALNWVSGAIKDSGMYAIPKQLLDDVLKAVQKRDRTSAVRHAAISLLGTMNLNMGNSLAMLFDGEKPALKQQIQTESDKNADQKPPKPIRGANEPSTSSSINDDSPIKPVPKGKLQAPFEESKPAAKGVAGKTQKVPTQANKPATSRKKEDDVDTSPLSPTNNFKETHKLPAEVPMNPVAVIKPDVVDDEKPKATSSQATPSKKNTVQSHTKRDN